jgi:hypothetical protein
VITGIWLSPDSTHIAVQLDEDRLIEYDTSDSDGYELDVVAHDWITCVPDPLNIHTDCIPLEQA